MNHDTDNEKWPAEAGDRSALPREVSPPRGLEDQVVDTLLARGLIHQDPAPVARHFGWRMMRASLAAAACAGLVAVGVLIGQQFVNQGPASTLTGAETDLYALLLYETEGYDAPGAAEALTRYGEYSEWVAEAIRRGQFVTGEDLVVDRGWLVVPREDGTSIEPATSVAADVPLSGIFFIRAKDFDEALELARLLPHVKYGGQVLVQKTIPTDTPPGDGH